MGKPESRMSTSPPPYTLHPNPPTLPLRKPVRAPSHTPALNHQPTSSSTESANKATLKTTLTENISTLRDLQQQHLTLPDIMYNYTLSGYKIVPRRHKSGHMRHGGGDFSKRDSTMKHQNQTTEADLDAHPIGEHGSKKEEGKGKWWKRASLRKGSHDNNRKMTNSEYGSNEEFTRDNEDAESTGAGDRLYIHEAKEVLVEDPDGDIVKEAEGEDYFGRLDKGRTVQSERIAS